MSVIICSWALTGTFLAIFCLDDRVFLLSPLLNHVVLDAFVSFLKVLKRIAIRYLLFSSGWFYIWLLDFFSYNANVWTDKMRIIIPFCTFFWVFAFVSISRRSLSSCSIVCKLFGAAPELFVKLSDTMVYNEILMILSYLNILVKLRFQNSSRLHFFILCLLQWGFRWVYWRVLIVWVRLILN